MSPEKPGEQLPHEASPELRKLAADVDDTLQRVDGDIEQIESDVQKIEQIEQDLKRKSGM
jgi:hypothetical protein